MVTLDIEAELDRRAYDGDWRGMMLISELRIMFPDLKIYQHYTGEKMMASKEINSLANKFDLDSAGRAYAYMDLFSVPGRVYSDPPCFYVARNNPHGFGLIPVEGWKQEMQLQEISDYVIARTAEILGQRQPVNYF